MKIVERLAELLTQYVTVAFIIEAIVEYFVASLPIAKGEKEAEWRAAILKWIAGGLGVGVAIGFQIRFLEAIGLATESQGVEYLDYVLTGLLLGRGSAAVHDMMMLGFLKKEALKPVSF